MNTTNIRKGGRKIKQNNITIPCETENGFHSLSLASVSGHCGALISPPRYNPRLGILLRQTEPRYRAGNMYTDASILLPPLRGFFVRPSGLGF